MLRAGRLSFRRGRIRIAGIVAVSCLLDVAEASAADPGGLPEIPYDWNRFGRPDENKVIERRIFGDYMFERLGFEGNPRFIISRNGGVVWISCPPV